MDKLKKIKNVLFQVIIDFWNITKIYVAILFSFIMLVSLFNYVDGYSWINILITIFASCSYLYLLYLKRKIEKEDEKYKIFVRIENLYFFMLTLFFYYFFSLQLLKYSVQLHSLID